MGALLIAGGLLVAIGFVLNPGIGVALMVVQACLILLCAYHFKQKSLSITAEALAVPEVPIYKDSNTHLKVNAKLLGVKPAIALEQTVGEDAHPKPTFADRIAGGLLRFFARTPNSSGGKSCVLPQTEVRSTQIPPRRMLSV